MTNGSCLCGSVTWEVTAEPFHAFNCHCKMCRKAHGSAFGTYWFLKPEELRWTSGTDTIKNYRSSPSLERSFCGACGSVVPYSGHLKDFIVAIAGCHDDGVKSHCNIFVAHNAPWHDVTGDLPRHDDYPVSTGYPRVEETPKEADPEGVVRGSCLCGEIEFQMTEPFKVVHNCHCSRCRRGRGAAHATNGITSTDGVQFTKGEAHLKRYKVPDAKFFTQVFCDVCGSKMPNVDAARGLTFVPLGALDDDPGVKAVDHIFVGSKSRWHDITDDLPKFEEGPTA